ncbi:SDR family oxidoreductase [Terasakiella sp.]|uniref:SDR family oxidoreductase n=1 Tax=Terasakiella sp. TaxID=2034861 RepID=UPI003AA96ADB
MPTIVPDLLNSCQNKNIVITGALGILGQVLCKTIAQSGAQVAVLDLDKEACEKFAAQLPITTQNGVHIGVGCDVRDPGSVSLSIEQICANFENVHGLLNNAATKTNNLNDFFEPFETYDLKTWQEVMSVNIDGMFLMAQAIGKHMGEKNIAGSIVQTASIYGVVGPDQRIYDGSYYMDREINTPAVYSASKAAVIGLSQYLATYWGDKGIRVNSLTPGGVESGQNNVFSKKYSQRVPLGRMASADEIAYAANFLLSDASSYINGQNLIVDGGLTAW